MTKKYGKKCCQKVVILRENNKYKNENMFIMNKIGKI